MDLVGIDYALFLLAAIILIVASSVFLWRASLDRPKFIDRMLTHAMIGLALWALGISFSKFVEMRFLSMLMLLDGVDDPYRFAQANAIVATREMFAHFLLFLTASLAAVISIIAQARRGRLAKATQEPR